jgi:hypothetical protein
MKRLTLHCLASSFHRFVSVNTILIHEKIAIEQCMTFQHICDGQDNKVFCLFNENRQSFFKLAIQIIASSLLCIDFLFRLSVKAMEANSGSDEAIKC